MRANNLRKCRYFQGKIKIDLKGIRHQHPAILRLMLRQMAESLTKEPVALTLNISMRWSIW
jgi:hypothetical protein